MIRLSSRDRNVGKNLSIHFSILLPGLDLHWQPHQTMQVLGEFMKSGLVTSMQPHHCDENPLGVTDYLQCRQALKPSGCARALRVLVGEWSDV